MLVQQFEKKATGVSYLKKKENAILLQWDFSSFTSQWINLKQLEWERKSLSERVVSKGRTEEVELGREPLEAFFVSMLVLTIFQYMGMNLDVCTSPVKTVCFKSFPGF